MHRSQNPDQSDHDKGPNPQYFGLADLDQEIEKYVNIDNGFFVDVGANDGLKQSNTLYFERYRGWSGILIEPSPIQFMNCTKLRGHVSQVFCNACVGPEYLDRFVEMTYADLMTVARGMENCIPDTNKHIESAKKFLKNGERPFNFGAIARTLTSILDEAGAPPQINLLSIDVEGVEMEVLRGLDFDKYEFGHIVIETRAPRDLYAFMRGHDYKLVTKLSKHDYLFEICDDEYRRLRAQHGERNYA